MSQAPQQHEEIRITWEDFHHHAQALSKQLKDIHAWQGIIAIARGGLIPAAIIAEELNIRLIDTVCISSYNNKFCSNESCNFSYWLFEF